MEILQHLKGWITL